MVNKEIKCPKCKKKEVVKRGIFKNGTIRKQRYGYKNCNYRFILDPFLRMRNDEKTITVCLDLYYNGLSLRKIQKHLNGFYPNEVSYSTVYRWIMKYVKVMAKFTDKQKLNVGYKLEGDEVEYHRRKSHKKGRKGIDRNWFVDIIDNKTRYVVSSDYVKERSPKELIKVYKKAKIRTGNQVNVFSTDGLAIYDRVLKNSFGLRTHRGRETKTSKIIHNVIKSREVDNFNYKIERFHNTLRERTKVMRGFHGCISSAQTLLKGFEIYYNYIREHQSLGNLTPSQVAIPNLQINGNNKWVEIIKKGYDG